MGAPLRLVALVGLIALVAAGPSSAEANFCQGCRALVSFASRVNASSAEARADYRELFQNYCTLHYPVSTDFQSGPCPIFVEGLFYLFEHVDPIHHCDQIGACEPRAKQAMQPSDDIYEYMRTSRDNAIATAAAPAPATSPKVGPVRQDGAICQFCEQLVGQVQSQLRDPAFIDLLKRQVDSFCDYLMVIGQEKQCRQFVDGYIDQLLDFVEKLNPKQYCQAIAMCPPKQGAVARTSYRLAAPLPSLADFQDFGIETAVVIGERPVEELALTNTLTHHETGPSCMLCKTVVKGLFEFVRENKTEANIMAGLERVCSTIYRPGQKRDECNSMVRAYTRELVQLLIDETDPEMICMLLELCAYKSELVEIRRLKPDVAATAAEQRADFNLADLMAALDGDAAYESIEACLECRMLIKYLKEQLDEPMMQHELEQWLVENLCQHIPERPLSDQCASMVQKNAPIFMHAIKGLLNPRAACRELGVCTAPSLVSVFSFEGATARRPAGLRALPASMVASQRGQLTASQKVSNRPRELRGQLCDQCVTIVTQIDDYLKSNPVEEDEAVIIDKVCNKMPEGTLRGECVFIVKTFGDEIVKAIQSMDNPRELCSKIYLCQAGGRL